MRRPSLAVTLALAAALCLPAVGAHAQGTIVDLRRGEVLVDEQGQADELEISAAEIDALIRRIGGRIAGIVRWAPDAPEARPEDEVAVAAATARLEAAGVVVQVCEVGAAKDAPTCVQEIDASRPLALVVIGAFGDLTVPTTAALGVRVIVAGTGGSTLAPGSVNLIVDPAVQAAAQGRALGGILASTLGGTRGTAALFTALPPSDADPVADAAAGGLAASVRKVRVASRLGPPAIHTVGELRSAVAGLAGLDGAFGEGLILDGATGEELAGLPPELSLVAWSCDGGVEPLVSPASPMRGCMDRSDEIAGTAAANAILSIMSSRDVPGLVLLPVAAYRGLVPVVDGSVALGREGSGAELAIADDARATATKRLKGATIGIIPGPDPDRNALVRAGLNEALDGINVRVETCAGISARQVRRCIADLARRDAVAVITLATGIDIAAAADDAVAAGTAVIAVDEPAPGLGGSVSIVSDERALALATGSMAAGYADTEWSADGQEAGAGVEAVIADESTPALPDPISPVLTQALMRRTPALAISARLGSSTEDTARAAARRIVNDYPGTRLIVGPRAAAVAAALHTIVGGDEKNAGMSPQIAAFNMGCSAALRTEIEDRVRVGSYLRGCVDADPQGAGRLAGAAILALASGGIVPERLEVAPVLFQP